MINLDLGLAGALLYYRVYSHVYRHGCIGDDLDTSRGSKPGEQAILVRVSM